MLNQTIVGLVIILFAVVIGAAIAYSFIKKKKDYKPEGIPKMVEDKKSGESTPKEDSDQNEDR